MSLLSYIAPRLNKRILIDRFRKYGFYTAQVLRWECDSDHPLVYEPEHEIVNVTKKVSWEERYVLYKPFAKNWTRYFKDGVPEGMDIDTEFLTEGYHIAESQRSTYAIRSRFFQEVVQDALWGKDIHQVVLVNAMFDSLPWRFQMGDHMEFYQAYMHENHKKKTEKSFARIPQNGKFIPVVIDYADPEKWLSQLEDAGLDLSKKCCFILSSLSRVYEKEEQKKFHECLEVLPEGSVVAHEYWAETMWGHPSRDIEPMRGDLYPFQFLLDNPEEMFDSEKWDTIKETPSTLNYDNRARLHPPVIFLNVFGLSTRTGKNTEKLQANETED